MTHHVIIYGRFAGLNEYISALNSRNRSVGNHFKKRTEQEILKQLEGQIPVLQPPVNFRFVFYEPNKKRDKDNVFTFFIKCWQDSLVRGGYIPNDGWAQIGTYEIDVVEDKLFPRIEIFIESED